MLNFEIISFDLINFVGLYLETRQTTFSNESQSVSVSF